MGVLNLDTSRLFLTLRLRSFQRVRSFAMSSIISVTTSINTTSLSNTTTARDALALASAVSSGTTSLIQPTATSLSGVDEIVIRNCSTWDILADTVKTLQATRKPWGVKLIVSVLERASALSTISSSSSSSSLIIFDKLIKPAITKEFNRGEDFVRSINSGTIESTSRTDKSFFSPGSLVALFPPDFIRVIEALDILAKNGITVNSNDVLLNAAAGAFNRGLKKVPTSLRTMRSRSLIRLLECGDRFDIMSRYGFIYKGEEDMWDSIALLAETRVTRLSNLSIINGKTNTVTGTETISNPHKPFLWTSSINLQLAFESISSELIARLSPISTSSISTKSSWKASQLGSICLCATSTLVSALVHEKELMIRSSTIDTMKSCNVQHVKESALALLYAVLEKTSSEGGLIRAARSMQSYWAGKATLSSADTRGAHGGGSSSSGSDTENKSRVSSLKASSSRTLKEYSDGSTSSSSPALHSPDYAPASFADVWLRQILHAISVVGILKLERFKVVAEAAFIATASCCSVQNVGALSTGFYVLRHVEAARSNSRDPSTIDWLAVEAVEPNSVFKKSKRLENSSADIDGTNEDSLSILHPKYNALARTFRTSPELLGIFLNTSKALQQMNETSTIEEKGLSHSQQVTITCTSEFLNVLVNAARIMCPSLPPAYYITDACSHKIGGGRWTTERSIAALSTITEASSLVSFVESSKNSSSQRIDTNKLSKGFTSTSFTYGYIDVCRMIVLSVLIPIPPSGSVHNKLVGDTHTSSIATLEEASAFLHSALAAGIGTRFPIPRAIDPNDYSRAALMSLFAAKPGKEEEVEKLLTTSSESITSFRPFVTVAATRIHRRLEALYSVVDDTTDSTSSRFLSNNGSHSNNNLLDEEEPDLIRRARVLRSKIALKNTGRRAFGTYVQRGRIMLPVTYPKRNSIPNASQLISPNALKALFNAVTCLVIQANNDLISERISNANTCLMQADLILAKWKRRVLPQARISIGGLKPSAFQLSNGKGEDDNRLHLSSSTFFQNHTIMSFESTTDALIKILFVLDKGNTQISSSPKTLGRFIEFGASLLTSSCLQLPLISISTGQEQERVSIDVVEYDKVLAIASSLFSKLLESTIRLYELLSFEESMNESSISALESLAYSSVIFSNSIRPNDKSLYKGLEWNAKSGIYLSASLFKGLHGCKDNGKRLLSFLESKLIHNRERDTEKVKDETILQVFKNTIQLLEDVLEVK
jgi:hypothetical protein